MNTYNVAKKRIFALLFAAFMLMSVASCSEKVGVLASDGDGGYKDSKTEISYRGAPSCYEAKGYLSEEIIAENDGVAFYALDGAPSTEWLWSPDFGMLLYSRNVTLPTLAELAPSEMYVCLEEDAKMKTAFEVFDQAKIDAILAAYENGEEVDYRGTKANYSFHLRFSSEEYPWLLYNLLYVQYAEDYIVYGLDENGMEIATNYGKDFIYNRSEKRFVAIGDELQEYIDEYYRNTDTDDKTVESSDAV